MLTRHPRRETEVVAEASPRLDDRSTTAWLRDRIDVWVAIVVGISWFGLTELTVALEPATDQSEPFIGVLLGITMTTLFVSMLVGLALRRRWGLVVSFAGAVVATAMVVACPTSGHHEFGSWWYGQMAFSLALIAISVAALRRDYSHIRR